MIMCFFKIVKGLVELDFNSFFEYKNTCTRGNIRKLGIAVFRKGNGLPDGIISSTTVESFCDKIAGDDVTKINTQIQIRGRAEFKPASKHGI